MDSIFNPSLALVRPLSSSFEKALSMEKPASPIDFALATKQHEAYVDLLRSLLSSVIEVPSSDSHPDCCFIEDTIEFLHSPVDPSKKLVIVNKLGAPSRQGEEQAVLVVLNQLLETRPSLQVVHLPEGTIDGGDVLFTGNMVLIGNSHRTSLEGIKALEKILSEFDLPVVTIPVVSGLHLKSCCSLIDKGVILISDNVAGKHIRGEIERLVPAENALQFIVIPDAVASNVLRIGHNIVIQDGFPLSEAILSGYAALKGFTIHKLNMSEFIKADGALTCCNVLLDI